MGYQGKGLNINGQGIVNPIRVGELPCNVGLGYVRKEVGECSKLANEQPKIYDERTSSHSIYNEGSTGTHQRRSRNKHSKTIQKVWRRKNNCSHCNEVGHHRAMFQVLHAQKAPLKK